MKINLFSGYFKSTDYHRAKELDFCLQKNRTNKWIDNVFIFTDRISYQEFFDQTKNYPNDINILANGDIYFDDSIKHALNIRPKDCYALTRLELVKTQVISFEDRHRDTMAQPRHSQDAWIFRGAVNNVYGGFYLGIPGCDNRIAHEIYSAGYNITNPSLTIKAIHVHGSDKRNYPQGQNIPRPYKWIEQTRL